MNPRVAFHLVAWNGMRYLPELFASLRAQTLAPTSLRSVDNGSEDGTDEWLRRESGGLVLRNTRNLGFAVGHNQAMRLSIDKWAGEDLDHCYVIICNQDIVLTPSCFEEMIGWLECHPHAGSVQGKWKRAFIEHPHDDWLAETVCSDVLDAVGLAATRTRRFVNRGAGNMDDGQFDVAEEIFGPTGALAAYRASALVSVRYNEEYFDQDFHSYFEDADLAWRLRGAGWESWYVPSAVAYHHRGLFAPERPSWRERMRIRRDKQPTLAMFSTRNRWWVAFKNETVWNALLSLPWWTLADLRQLLYSLFFEPQVVLGIVVSLRWWPRMWRKRRQIMHSRACSSHALRRWFS